MGLNAISGVSIMQSTYVEVADNRAPLYIRKETVVRFALLTFAQNLQSGVQLAVAGRSRSVRQIDSDIGIKLKNNSKYDGMVRANFVGCLVACRFPGAKYIF